MSQYSHQPKINAAITTDTHVKKVVNKVIHISNSQILKMLSLVILKQHRTNVGFQNLLVLSNTILVNMAA